MNLHGKTVLITGAAKRIGREIALALAAGGAIVVIHYSKSRKDALELKRKINDFGGTAVLATADFSPKQKSIQKTIQRFVRDVYQRVSRVDVLVNNASVFYPTTFGKITEGEWDDLMTVNLKAPFFLAQEIGSRMVTQRSGKIINLVDWTGLRPSLNYLPYSISKAGLIAATKGLARLLAPRVQVNSIAPGPILPYRGMSGKQKKAILQRTLLKRFGHPRDIAETVRFLIERTDFITGALIPVDGGSLVA